MRDLHGIESRKTLDVITNFAKRLSIDIED